MATFGPFAKSKFFDFFNFLFFRLKRCFFSLECHKTHFPRLAWLKKKDAKMVNFGPKRWTNPFEKKNINFLTFSTSCFYSLERHFFALEYHKTHFSGLDCLKKNEKMTNFALLVFIAQKGISSRQNIIKHIFLDYIAQGCAFPGWGNTYH